MKNVLILILLLTTVLKIAYAEDKPVALEDSKSTKHRKLSAFSAKPSLSLNYLFIGNKEKYGAGVPKNITHHGIGIQSKIHLKNHFILMPDIGYFFSDYGKTGSSATNYSEYKTQYFTANVNLAFVVPFTKSFSILPFVGVGYFQEYNQMHLVGSGGGGYQDPSGGHQGGYYNIIVNDNPGSLVCNLGLNLELQLLKNIFLTAGLKYMLDPYDTKYNSFPHINVGVGYSF